MNGGYASVRIKWWPVRAANNMPNVELRFANQWYDLESGLHYNSQRCYDPDTGQYCSPDPIGVAGGLRPWGYVHDPSEWVDPLGLSGCDGMAHHGEIGYRFSKASLRHILRRHSPHCKPPKQEPYASMSPNRKQGSLFPREWSNRDIATAIQEVADNPANHVPSIREGFTGKVYEGVAERNGIAQNIRVITDWHDPHLPLLGTGSGIITSGFPIKR